MAGLLHDFLLVARKEYDYWDYSNFYNHPQAIHPHDDLTHYIGDSSKWIPCHVPARGNKLHEYKGLNLYGPTIIKAMRIQGIVQEGEGEASVWLSQYADVYRSWTGMTLVPGSLNVHLAAKFDWNDTRVEPFKKIYSLIPYGGNRDICLIPCEIYKDERDKIYGFAWATTQAADDFDYRVLEIITSVKLREVLQLNNGSVVTIDIPAAWRG